jgi:hypothetical protein
MTYDTDKLKVKLADLTERRSQTEKALQEMETKRQNGFATLNAITGAILVIEEMLKDIEPPVPKE